MRHDIAQGPEMTLAAGAKFWPGDGVGFSRVGGSVGPIACRPRACIGILARMSIQIHEQLAAIGLTLPAAPRPVASYKPAITCQGMVYVSGQLPLVEGELTCRGAVPSKVDLDSAKQAACLAGLNALAAVDDVIQGDWSKVHQIVRVGVFVASDTGFDQQSKVADGVSEMLQAVLAEHAGHARAAVGVSELPLGSPVEVEMLVALTLDQTPARS